MRPGFRICKDAPGTTRRAPFPQCGATLWKDLIPPPLGTGGPNSLPWVPVYTLGLEISQNKIGFLQKPNGEIVYFMLFDPAAPAWSGRITSTNLAYCRHKSDNTSLNFTHLRYLSLSQFTKNPTDPFPRMGLKLETKRTQVSGDLTSQTQVLTGRAGVPVAVRDGIQFRSFNASRMVAQINGGDAIPPIAQHHGSCYGGTLSVKQQNTEAYEDFTRDLCDSYLRSLMREVGRTLNTVNLLLGFVALAALVVL